MCNLGGTQTGRLAARYRSALPRLKFGFNWLYIQLQRQPGAPLSPLLLLAAMTEQTGHPVAESI